MKTPKEYTEMIKKKEVTTKLVGEVLYSLNKRAKNAREMEIKSRSSRNPHSYENMEKYKENKERYYKDKDYILSFFKPKCIHWSKMTFTNRDRICDYMPEYDLSKHEVEGSYFDQYLGKYVDYYTVSEIVTKDLYYLYYEIGENSFHTPIDKGQLENCNMEIIEIDENFKKYGKNINDLLSVQFCEKLVSLLGSGEYKIID
ncbi:hypothetical protein ACQUEF_05915 [Vagococcus fluvialis]|uniref:hypothetical protein n=1 Tax=Vagococcus fluvialis TaxID=2738 RepID=UPI003D0CB605